MNKSRSEAKSFRPARVSAHGATGTKANTEVSSEHNGATGGEGSAAAEMSTVAVVPFINIGTRQSGLASSRLTELRDARTILKVAEL